jgi:hypothetical protein
MDSRISAFTVPRPYQKVLYLFSSRLKYKLLVESLVPSTMVILENLTGFGDCKASGCHTTGQQ